MKARASTADLVAAVRALHQRDPVRLINDPYAIVLCGRYLRRILRIRPAGRIIAHCLPGLRPSMLGVLIRARYAEVALEAAVGAGVTQYVIIGAGLDSFALRRPDLMTRLQVFEIDRAAMQEVKRDRLRRAGVELPRGLHFVSADLGRIPVMKALSHSAFDPSRRAFLSLLGVIYYLPREVRRLDHALDCGGRGPRFAPRGRPHARHRVGVARAQEEEGTPRGIRRQEGRADVR